MGACASAQRRSSGNSSRKLRASLVHSDPIVHEKPENVVDASVDPPVSTSSHGFTSRVSPLNAVTSFSNHGSKEETFFDSQLWLESDCDDEFYSVNGDFTPSRGSTPLYRSVPGTPVSRNLSSRVNRAVFEGTSSSPNYTSNTCTEEPNRPMPSRGSSPLHRSASAAAPRVDSDAVAATKSPPAEKKKRKKLGELFRESFRGKRQDEECRLQTEADAEASQLESDNADGFILGMKSQPKTMDGKPGQTQWCFPRLHSARGFKKMTPPAPAPPIVVNA